MSLKGISAVLKASEVSGCGTDNSGRSGTDIVIDFLCDPLFFIILFHLFIFFCCTVWPFLHFYQILRNLQVHLFVSNCRIHVPLNSPLMPNRQKGLDILTCPAHILCRFRPMKRSVYYVFFQTHYYTRDKVETSVLD